MTDGHHHVMSLIASISFPVLMLFLIWINPRINLAAVSFFVFVAVTLQPTNSTQPVHRVSIEWGRRGAGGDIASAADSGYLV